VFTSAGLVVLVFRVRVLTVLWFWLGGSPGLRPGRTRGHVTEITEAGFGHAGLHRALVWLGGSLVGSWVHFPFSLFCRASFFMYALMVEIGTHVPKPSVPTQLEIYNPIMVQ
jgi:hypothetical protein